MIKKIQTYKNAYALFRLWYSDWVQSERVGKGVGGGFIFEECPFEVQHGVLLSFLEAQGWMILIQIDHKHFHYGIYDRDNWWSIQEGKGGYYSNDEAMQEGIEKTFELIEQKIESGTKNKTRS